MSGTMKVELIDHMGSDLSVVNAARVSFDKKSTLEVTRIPAPDGWDIERKLKEADAKLIRYLAKHDHWTPFAHTAISLRVGAPVPIRTQCFKHKQGLVENEESRRYIKSRPELYVPPVWRKAADSAKQGSSDEVIEYLGMGEDGTQVRPLPFGITGSGKISDAYRLATRIAIGLYEEMIESGVCPEQARFVLPQGCIVNWIWTGNLYAFANFYLKRTDAHAQKEVQQLACLVGRIIEPLFPVSWAALTEVD